MKIGHSLETGISPLWEGLYVVEVYHGWTLLEFKKGEWWHKDFIGRWTACIPVQWVGPLPVRRGKHKTEYDL